MMNRNRMTKIKKSKTMNNWEKLKNLNANMKFAMLSTNKFYQDLLNSIWELLVLWTSKILLKSVKLMVRMRKMLKMKPINQRYIFFYFRKSQSLRKEKEVTALNSDIYKRIDHIYSK